LSGLDRRSLVRQQRRRANPGVHSKAPGEAVQSCLRK
jgi:hypothetical protein